MARPRGVPAGLPGEQAGHSSTPCTGQQMLHRQTPACFHSPSSPPPTATISGRGATQATSFDGTHHHQN
eukprot:scaffold70902_cov24-Cyclotella_meneghiniana.AAC.1